MKLTHRAVTAAVVAVSGAILVAPTGAIAAKSRSCSVRTLHFSYTAGGVTFGDKVIKLTTTGRSCAIPEKVAGTVAEDLLHKRRVPRTVERLRVTVKNPCSGCAPLWTVTAKGGGATVSFTVMGGAK